LQLTKAKNNTLLAVKGGGITVFELIAQADSGNSICMGGKCWGAHLRRKDRANSLANRELLSVLITTQA
jgi:hypothetical protein